MKISFSALQPLGRALMLPIAVLPVAGLILRLGQPDLLNLPFVAAAGDAIFSNLGLLFAIGVAVGFARENHGAAGLAGAVGYLVATTGAKTLIPIPAEALHGFTGDAVALAGDAFKDHAAAKLAVPMGIVNGAVAGYVYNRFGDIRLPSYLAFFGGRRFPPIVSGGVGVLLAAVFGLGWPLLEAGVDGLSRGIVGAGPVGLIIYGLLNRLLIVTGLHHILNNVVWFIIGDYHGATGDLHRFFAGDPTAGAFMSGYFPVMMFGLPAACLAMYHAARPERRPAIAGMLGSMAATAFLTGVTEPVEFSFMFLAPVLYAVHAVLTGLAMALMDLLGVKLGFGFSAGAIDYVLNYGKATRPWLLAPVGLAYAALYYVLFRVFISTFNLQTPGREPMDETAPGDDAPTTTSARAQAFAAALGGADNLLSVDACTTRLRLRIRDRAKVNEADLRRLGARGVLSPSPGDLQVVLGPEADQVASDIRTALKLSVQPTPAVSAGWEAETSTDAQATARHLLAALGGAGNIVGHHVLSGRICVTLVSDTFDEGALLANGVLAAVRIKPRIVHLLLGSRSRAVGAEFSAELATRQAQGV